VDPDYPVSAVSGFGDAPFLKDVKNNAAFAVSLSFSKDPPPGRFFRFTPFCNIVMKTVIPFGCRGISKIGLFHFEIFIG
jgi:hypothetical protein